jgi:hypothetical protein
MTKELTSMIEEDMNNAYTGQADITFSQALARIAAEMYDPYNKFDNETGVYVETNSHQWEQYFFLQNVANQVWASMYDTRTNKKGYVKGVAHKLEKARANLNKAAAQHDGTEISINNMNQAADWVERLQDKLTMFDEMYQQIAAMMDCATGIPHKPYEPWTTQLDAKPTASTEAEAELAARLAEMGINISTGHVANTDGVATSDEDAA